MYEKHYFRLIFSGITVLILWNLSGCTLWSVPRENPPQTMYYVRYDTCMLNHRAIQDNLIMVPAYEEFRMQRFQRAAIPCTITPAIDSTPNELRSQAIESAIKKILEARGLIHVTSLNAMTVISYEGLVKSPFQVTGTISQDQKNKQKFHPPPSPGEPVPFSCTTNFEFSPLCFPNEWEKQRHIHLIKQKIKALWRSLP